MMITVIQLLVLFFLPGLIVLLVHETYRERNIKSNFFEFLFKSILISTTLTSYLVSILLLFNKFSLRGTLVPLILVSLFCLFFFFYRLYRTQKRISFDFAYKEHFFIVLLVVVCLFTFSKPFDPLVSYDDGHMNMAIGIMMLNTGTGNYVDDKLANISEEYRPLFNTGFTGLNSWDSKNAVVETSYYHLTHMWIALVYGVTNNIFLTSYIFPFLGLLTILAIYYTGKHFFNQQIGFIAAFLSSVSFPQIWFARYTGNTEIPFEFLLFAGLYIFALFLKREEKIYAILAPLLFGLLFLVRIDSVLIIPAFIFFLLIIYLLNLAPKNQRYMNVSFLAVFLFGALSAYITAYKYTAIYFDTIPVKEMTYGLIFSLVCLMLIIIYKQRVIVEKIRLHFRQHSSKYIIVFLVVVSLIFAYLFITSSGEIFLRNQENRFMMAWYITAPIMMLGIGALLFAVKEKESRLYFFILVFLSFTLFYLESAHNRNVHPWVMRRYIIASIPFIYIGFSYFLFKVGLFFKSKQMPLIIAVSAFIATAGVSSNLFRFTELEGTTQQSLNAFQNYSNEIIINVDWPNSRLLYPPRFIENKNIYPISRAYKRQSDIYLNENASRLFLGFISDMKNKGKDIIIVNPDSEMKAFLEEDFDLTLKQSNVITFNHWPRVIGKFSNAHKLVSMPLDLYLIQ